MNRTQLRCIAEFKFISVDVVEGLLISMLLPIATTIPLANWNQCSPPVVQNPGLSAWPGVPSGLVGLVGRALMPNVV